MSDTKRIEIGDTVEFLFDSFPPIQGVVEYMPQATGDCWHIMCIATGKPAYIQNFAYMTLIRKKGAGQ